MNFNCNQLRTSLGMFNQLKNSNCITPQRAQAKTDSNVKHILK